MGIITFATGSFRIPGEEIKQSVGSTPIYWLADIVKLLFTLESCPSVVFPCPTMYNVFPGYFTHLS